MNEETKLILEALEYLLSVSTPTYKKELLMSKINDIMNPIIPPSLTDKTRRSL